MKEEFFDKEFSDKEFSDKGFSDKEFLDKEFSDKAAKEAELKEMMENRGITEEKETSWKQEILSTIIYMLIVCAATLLLVQYVGQRTEVSGDSMNATLEDGDNLIIYKLGYRLSDPERFDIIVFPFKHEEDTYYIKRIIGLPGETVQIQDGLIYIDGEVLEESYGNAVMTWEGIAENLITLGEDEYFVLGDNRNNSSDSRDPSVGLIKREDIIGKASVRIWPLNKIGILEHQ